MSHAAPERLRNEQYMSLSSPFRIFRHHIDARIEVHWHEFFELALVAGGQGIHAVNGTSVPLRRGLLFLMTPADFHEIIPDPGQRIDLYNVIFSEPFIRPELFRQLFSQRGDSCVWLGEEAFPAFEAEFARMWRESEHWQEGSEFIVQGALERVLIDRERLCRNGSEKQEMAGPLQEPPGDEARRLHPSIVSAVTYIQHHFREPLTLAEVAAHAGLSANYFSECFSKQVGASFQCYVQERRLQFAHSLLCVTALPVTEICYASGFGTLNHFERAFKKKYGRAPRHLRKERNSRPGHSRTNSPGG
ncbi:MAG: AraC family transcriptional regulator [Paenibacillus dendritiformis]|uniref:AraC family transcriptional regulator n=1 Tax=uncultured Paenibacillus sp. TaxID=227322 RepID=UPI0025D981AC|nr:AraC family transcriptional regulator [uncultured Paenibacillus sp.]MDU5142444.1 AraC family transcriptional regulator [Paenibacillus dendritiformis]